MCIRRAQELSWARSIIESPDKIVANWQVMGGLTLAMLISRTLEQKGSHIIVCSSVDARASRGEL